MLFWLGFRVSSFHGVLLKRFFRSLSWRGVLALVSFLGLAWPVLAQKGDDSALKARLEKLEKADQQLLKQFEELKEKPKLTLEEEAPEKPKTLDKTEEGKEDKKLWVVGENLGFQMRWNHGQEGESADKAFRIHVGGRLQIDSAFIGTNDRVMF